MIPYISWLGHGTASLAAPGVFTGCQAHMFAIDASQAAMQALVDQLLNPAGNGDVRYEVALPVALLTFLDIAKCTSGTDTLGWLPGRECAIWVPLIELHANNPFATRLVLWSPYIFINYTIGMVTGREIWGWPKVLAKISVASDTPATPQFACSTTYFPTMSATTQGVDDLLYRIVQTAPASQTAPVWTDGATAIADLIDGFLGGLGTVLADALQFSPELPCVVLKQFRQAGDSQNACYQAIVDSPIQVTNFLGGGPLFEHYALEVTTCASHPIISDLLGRVPDPVSTTVAITFAAQLSIDFQALTGANIIVAGE